MLVYQEKRGNRFWMLFHGNTITAALGHADFPQLRKLHRKKAPVTATLQDCVGYTIQAMD